MSDAGIDGELKVGSAPGALLDNAGQLMGLWIMLRYTHDRLGLPITIDRIRFFGARPAVGEAVEASVRVTSIEATAVRADLEVVHRGRVWARIDGWVDRRFDSDEVVWPVLLFPERSVLTETRPGGWELARERWRTSASRELMMRRYLGEAEREAYARHNPRAQRLFLLGRIAVKDAVRRWLWAHGAGPVWPVEIEISNEESGRPIAVVPGDAELSVSIAHTPYVGVAIVSRGPVGIDAEQVEPRSELFASTAFAPAELEILLGTRSPESRDEWLTRGWAAKEAVAKAAGTGLGGRPRDFVLSFSEENVLVVNGHSVESERIDDMVVAWTVPETTEEGRP
jgi:phosphopantetheine--protein transferase-like protein